MKIWKNYKHYIIPVLLGILIKLFVPASKGLTPVGINVLAMFIPLMYLWIFVGTDWVSFLALAGLILSGVLSQGEVWAQSFGHPVVATVIATMALNECLTRTGVIDKVSTWFITRNIVKGRPYVFIFMFNLAALVLGIILQPGAITIMFMALAKMVCDIMGYKKGEPFYTCLMAGIVWQCAFTAAATPIGKALPLILIGAVKDTHGIEITFSQWMSVGIPFAFLSFAISMLVIRFFWKPDTSKYVNYDVDIIKQSATPLSLEGKITATIFAFVVFLWIFPDFLGFLSPTLSEILRNAGVVVPPVIGLALLCTIRVNGKPIGNFTEMAKGVPLGLVVFVGSVCVIGNAVSSPTTGIPEALNNVMAPITAGMAPIIIIGFAFFGSLLLTNFISNTVTMLLFYNLAVTLLTGSDVNIPGLVIMIGLLSSVAFLTPAASVVTPITFGTGDITISNTIKPNIVLLIALFIVYMLVFWPIVPMLL